MRIHVASKTLVDAVWQILIGQSQVTQAEIHVDGAGFLYEVVRNDDGRWTTRREAP